MKKSTAVRSDAASKTKRKTGKKVIHPGWEPPIPGRRRVVNNWDEYMALAQKIVGRFHNEFDLRYFDYNHPERLQKGVPRRFKRQYPVRVAYTDWGEVGKPTLVCCGGVANSAMRFNYLAADLMSEFRVLCMDWVGRGRSGWMSDERDYSLGTYAEQLKQLIESLGEGPVILLGSSLGGSAAMELTARHPRLVKKLILNDIGPYIPKKRRQRRSQTLARHYVFRDPSDLLRRIGASQKNDGPISDDIRFNITFHQTKWSDDDGGRVYRHDVRALQAYKKDAEHALEQWALWKKIKCPVLLIHGMLSDALHPRTIDRMRSTRDIELMHVPDTGHTPVLSDRNQSWFIREWMHDGIEPGTEWSVLHAPLRGDPNGNGKG